MKHLFISTDLMSLSYTEKTTKSQPYIHRGLVTLAINFLCACLLSSVHAHGSKIRGRNFKRFETSVGRER